MNVNENFILTRRVDALERRLLELQNDLDVVSTSLDRAALILKERSTRLAVHVVWNDHAYDFLSLLGDTLSEHLEDGHPVRRIAYRACADFTARNDELMPVTRRDVLAILARPVEAPRRLMSFIE